MESITKSPSRFWIYLLGALIAGAAAWRFSQTEKSFFTPPASFAVSGPPGGSSTPPDASQGGPQEEPPETEPPTLRRAGLPPFPKGNPAEDHEASRRKAMALLDQIVAIKPDSKETLNARGRSLCDLEWAFTRDRSLLEDVGITTRIRELYFQTPDSDASLKNSLLDLWIWAPPQFEQVLALAVLEDDPCRMSLLATCLVNRNDARGLEVLQARLRAPCNPTLAERIWGQIHTYGKSPEVQRIVMSAISEAGDPSSRRAAASCLILDERFPDHLALAETLLRNPAEDPEVKKQLLYNYPIDATDAAAFRAFVFLGLSPSQPPEIRATAAKTVGETMLMRHDYSDACLLPEARETLERILANDPSQAVRQVARKYALEIWRCEASDRQTRMLEAAEGSSFKAPVLTEEERESRRETLLKETADRVRWVRQAVGNGSLSEEQAERLLDTRDPAEREIDARFQREEEAYARYLEALHPEPVDPSGKRRQGTDEDP